MKHLRTLLCIFILISSSGCATMLYPRRVALPEEKRAGIDWTMFNSDILFTAGIGLIIDFLHGTIYRPVEGYRGTGFDRGLFTPGKMPEYPGPVP
jgi:hypothetical protein